MGGRVCKETFTGPQMPDLDSRPLFLWYDNDDQDREDDSGTKEDEIPEFLGGGIEATGQEM